MAGSKREAREDGQPYSTPLGDYDPGMCGYCGAQLVARAEGRPPKYCGPSCRSGAYRRSRPSWKTRRGLNRGQLDVAKPIDDRPTVGDLDE